MNRICLNMIVKNEEATLPRLLASVRDQISCYVIVDTGSTDSTRAVIERELFGVPGQIVNAEFENFSQARNTALGNAIAFDSGLDFDYLLLADADMELVGTLPELTEPAYLMEQRVNGGLTYQNLRLVHRDAVVKYHGATHEYLEVSGNRTSLTGAHFIDHADGSNRADKFERDIRLLTHAVADNPADERAWFYLAQSYKDAGDLLFARSLYEHRARMTWGWDEETWYSLLQVARLTEWIEPDRVNAVHDRYWEAHEYRPHRAEAYRYLGNYLDAQPGATGQHYHERADAIPYPVEDLLFIDASAYKNGGT